MPTGDFNVFVDRALAIDAQAPGMMRAAAHKGSREAVAASSRQFEAMFIEQMLKAMRSTVPQNELWNSDQTRFFQGMADQQLATSMAGRSGFGLAELMTRQVMGQLAADKVGQAQNTAAVPEKT